MPGDQAPEILCALPDGLGSVRRVVLLKNRREKQRRAPVSSVERLLIQLTNPSDAEARRTANGIQALFAYVHRVRYGDDFGIYQLPDRRLVKENTIFENELVALEERLCRFGYIPDLFVSKLGSYIIVPESEMAYLFYYLPTVLNSRPLFDACHFFEASSSDFAFVGDTVTEICRSPGDMADNEQDRLRLENVVLNAYRAVEALVGEPGRENRFRTRLLEWGIDFDEKVGFRGYPQLPVGSRMYWLRDLRDEAAAHGRRRRRKPLTFFEAMEAQELANSVLHKALWHMVSTQPGRNRAEMAYLLCRMFGRNAKWSTTTTPELGNKSPVEVVRESGGLERLWRVVRTEDREA